MLKVGLLWLLYQAALKVRRKIKVKLPLQTSFFLNIIYFFLSFLLTTFTTEVRVSHLSIGKQITSDIISLVIYCSTVRYCFYKLSNKSNR